MTDDTVQFYRTSGCPGEGEAVLPDGYSFEMWAPSSGGTSPQLGTVGLVYRAFHALRVFHGRSFGAVLIRHGDNIVHRSMLFPPYFRFPFMQRGDIQIGATWTDYAHRSRGLAIAACRAVIAGAPASASIWYITETSNTASERVAQHAGLTLAGAGRRRPRLGMNVLGFFDLQDAESS